eukprot:g9970.t1
MSTRVKAAALIMKGAAFVCKQKKRNRKHVGACFSRSGSVHGKGRRESLEKKRAPKTNKSGAMFMLKEGSEGNEMGRGAIYAARIRPACAPRWVVC